MSDKPTFQQEVQKAIEATAIDPENINGAMLNQSHLFAKQASRAALLRANLKRGEVQLKLMEAEVSLTKRKQFAEAGTKVTEDLVKASTLADPAYSAAVGQLEDIRQKSMVLDAVIEAMRQRSDMLIQLAADLRRERSQNQRTE